MININNFIQEKLKINSKSKINNQPNEEVLVLDADINKNYTFDLKLFLNNLEFLYKEYGNVPLSISLENKIFFKIYNVGGVNPNTVIVNIASGSIKFLYIGTYQKIDYAYDNINAIEKILDIFKDKYKKYNNFTFNLYTEDNHKKYMYVWYSDIYNIVRIDFSNTEYKKLLKQNYFE